MSDGGALLDLQEVDIRLDQLRHRRATLPEVDALGVVDTELAELAAADAADEATLGTLGAEQKRLEDEVAGIEDKAARERERQSTIIVPREAEAVQAELASLARRQGELEDRILELMEEAEPFTDARAERSEQLTERRDRRAELAAALGDAQAAVDAELAEAEGRRQGIVDTVDAQLLRSYDTLRERVGGVVVGRLDGSMCTACSLQLPPTEVEQLRAHPAGSVHPCDCGLLIALV
ncbi:MAG: hypothetical protein AAGA17_12975 [Actinomycetota bacterium]